MIDNDTQEDPLFPLYAPALTPEGDRHIAIAKIVKALVVQGYDQTTLDELVQRFHREYHRRFTTYQEDPLFPRYAIAFEQDKALYPSLEEIVIQLLAEGYERPYLVKSLTQFGLMLRSQGKEEEEDTVLDILDALTGWCSPHMRI